MSRKFQIKTIPISWIEHNERRLDCNPYMSGSIETKEIISRLAVKKEPLQKLTEGIINAGRIPRFWVTDPQYGIPFLTSSDFLHADLSNIRFIAKSAAKRNPKLLIKKNTILITRSGSIGRLAFARPDMDQMACTEDVLRVIPNESDIKPGYLYAYLGSRYGIPMVISGTYGAIIQHIEPHHINNLPVPRLGDVELRAHELIEEASSLLTKYQSLLNEATKLYFDSSGLSDITSHQWHSWGTDFGFKANVKAHSFRALNFNPRFNRLCEKIKEGKWKPLIELCQNGTLKSGPRFKRIDADPEYAYQLIGQKQIFWLKPEGRWIAKNSIGSEVLVPNGTILVAAQGTLGEYELFCRAEFITGDALDRAYSQHFLRVIADEKLIERGALYSFLRSETAFRMLRSASTGSKLQDFHFDVLSNLPIPYPDKEIRIRCNNLVNTAYILRDKAIELERQAQNIVEQAIKEGGR